MILAHNIVTLTMYFAAFAVPVIFAAIATE